MAWDIYSQMVSYVSALCIINASHRVLSAFG